MFEIESGRFGQRSLASETYGPNHGQGLGETVDTLGVAGQPMLISSTSEQRTGPGAIYEWAEPSGAQWRKVAR